MAMRYSHARSERPELADRTPCGQQSLLKHVLGVLDRSEDPVAVRLQFAAVGLDEFAEGLAIAGPGPGEDCLDHRAVILPPDYCLT